MALGKQATDVDAVNGTREVTVEMTAEEYEAFSRNQIYFVVDNQTPFTLVANDKTFADWGDFASGPVTTKPFISDGVGGHVMSSHSPFTGSAGMVGFSVTGPSGRTVYLRLLGSNPYLSVRSNWAYVAIPTSDNSIDQANYNALYKAETKSASIAFEGQTLSVVGSIGQADEATAKFAVAFK